MSWPVRISLCVALASLGGLGCVPPPTTEEAVENTKQARRPGGKVGEFNGSGLVDLAAIVGKDPDTVEQTLGKHRQAGRSRISCVRFLPERVFFACDQESRLYDDPKGQLGQIRVEYEDGKAASVAITGLPGTGEFDPLDALELVGMSLPEPPGHSNPSSPMAKGVRVDLWSWVNIRAKLSVDGRAYRVEVSIVDGDWKRSKVEIVLNDQLTEDERSRVKAPGTTP